MEKKEYYWALEYLVFFVNIFKASPLWADASISRFVCLSVRLTVCLSVRLSVSLSVRLSVRVFTFEVLFKRLFASTS